jgi:hypothetical protein
MKDVLSRVDLLGMFVLMACLSLVVIVLNTGGQDIAWNSPIAIGLLVAAGMMWIAFWTAERYAKMPIAPVRLFVKWKWRNVPLMFGE